MKTPSQVKNIQATIQSMIEAIQSNNHQQWNQILKSEVLQNSIKEGHSPIRTAIDYIFSNSPAGSRFTNEEEAILSQQYLFIELYKLEGLSWYIRSKEDEFDCSNKALNLLSAIGANHYEEALELIRGETPNHRALGERILAKLPGLALGVFKMSDYQMIRLQLWHGQRQSQQLMNHNQGMQLEIDKLTKAKQELEIQLRQQKELLEATKNELEKRSNDKQLIDRATQTKSIKHTNKETQSNPEQKAHSSQTETPKFQESSSQTSEIVQSFFSKDLTETQPISVASEVSTQDGNSLSKTEKSKKKKKSKKPQDHNKYHDLELAIRSGDIIKFRTLVRAKTFQDHCEELYKPRNGNSLLHEAAQSNKIEMVKFLLRFGIRPRIKNNDNKTADQLTSNIQIKEYIQYLQKHEDELLKKSSIKSDDNLEKNIAYLSLYLGISKCSIFHMKESLLIFFVTNRSMLINKDLNIDESHIFLILRCAINCQSTNLLRAVADLNYNLNSKIRSNKTIAHYMAEILEIKPKVVKTALDLGVDRLIKNSSGEDALDIAQRKENSNFISSCLRYQEESIRQSSYVRFRNDIKLISKLKYLIIEGSNERFIEIFQKNQSAITKSELRSLQEFAFKYHRHDLVLDLMEVTLKAECAEDKELLTTFDDTRHNSPPVISHNFNEDEVINFISKLKGSDPNDHYLSLNKAIDSSSPSLIFGDKGSQLFDIALKYGNISIVATLIDLGVPIDDDLFIKISNKDFQIGYTLIYYLIEQFDGLKSDIDQKREIAQNALDGNSSPEFISAWQTWHKNHREEVRKQYPVELIAKDVLLDDIDLAIEIEDLDLAYKIFCQAEPKYQYQYLCIMINYGLFDLVDRCIKTSKAAANPKEDIILAIKLFGTLITGQIRSQNPESQLIIRLFGKDVHVQNIKQGLKQIIKNVDIVGLNKNNCLHEYVRIQSKVLDISDFNVVLDSISDPKILNAKIDHRTPLHEAAIIGNPSLTKALISKEGVDLNAKDSQYGNTAMHLAVIQGNHRVVKYLIDAGARIDLLNNKGQDVTLGLQKSKNSLIQICLRLIEKKVLEIRTKNFETLLEESKIDEALQEIKKIKDGDSKYLKKCAHIATKKGESDVLRAILGKPISSNIQNDTLDLITTAIESDQTAIVQLLCNFGVSLDGNDNNMPPIHLAIKLQKIEITRILALYSESQMIDLEKIKNAKEENAFNYLGRMINESAESQNQESLGNYMEIIEMFSQNLKNDSYPPLLDNETTGPVKNILFPGCHDDISLEHAIKQISKKWGNPIEKQQFVNETLIMSAKSGHLILANLSLQNGADPNFSDKYGRAALFYAAAYNKIQIVKLLLGVSKTCVDQKNHTNGCTALSISLLENNHEVTELLLMAKADPNTKDHRNNSPLIFASVTGKANLAITLIEYGARVNDKCEGGCTALKIASIHNHTSIVRTLLESGADASIVDDKDLSPLAMLLLGAEQKALAEEKEVCDIYDVAIVEMLAKNDSLPNLTIARELARTSKNSRDETIISKEIENRTPSNSIKLNPSQEAAQDIISEVLGRVSRRSIIKDMILDSRVEREMEL